jgi:hypothetical protein
VFNNLNEFIIERILFFGNTTNRVKQSKVNELHKYKINRSIKIILKDKADKISQSESKKFDRESRKTEITARW